MDNPGRSRVPLPVLTIASVQKAWPPLEPAPWHATTQPVALEITEVYTTIGPKLKQKAGRAAGRGAATAGAAPQG